MWQSFLVLTVLFSYFIPGWSLSLDCNCDYLLKVHSVIPGVGVFANRNISKYEVLDRCVSVLVPGELVTGLLDRYVFSAYGVEHQYSVLALGMCMMYNHHSRQENAKVFHPADLFPSYSGPRVPDGAITFNVVAQRDIVAGEELFINYGYDRDYWTKAGHAYVDVTQVAAEENKDPSSMYTNTIPGCHHLMTEIVGGKVYAAQYIEEGDLVELSRALLVPPRFAAEPNLTRYVWMEENSDFENGLGMVILGHGALYSASGGDDAETELEDEDEPKESTNYNLRYEWYTYDDSKARRFYWDDFLVEQQGMVAFIATRAIEINEELIVPLKVDPLTGRRNAYNSMLLRRP